MLVGDPARAQYDPVAVRVDPHALMVRRWAPRPRYGRCAPMLASGRRVRPPRGRGPPETRVALSRFRARRRGRLPSLQVLICAVSNAHCAAMSTLLIRHAECVAHFDDARRELRAPRVFAVSELEPPVRARIRRRTRAHRHPGPPNLRPQSIDPAEVIAIRAFADLRNCSTYADLGEIDVETPAAV